MQTYYEVLNVSPNASINTIKTTYRRLALLYHPDRAAPDVAINITGDPSTHSESTSTIASTTAQFIAIQRAYATLSDPQLRADYDLFLKQQQYVTRSAGILNDVEVLDMDYDATTEMYTYPCRCGNIYSCPAEDIESSGETQGCNIILPCSGCSLSICVINHH
jgi:diphthamide biosynthesis protein 4